MSLIGLLVIVLVACVVLWAARALIAAFAVPQPISTVIYVVIVLIVVVWLLSRLGVAVP
jgi:hypothetical protein